MKPPRHPGSAKRYPGSGHKLPRFHAHFIGTIFAIVLLLVQLGLPSPTSAEELVKFSSAAFPSRQADGAPGGNGPSLTRRAEKPDVQGYLTRPKGAGPFPAVVLLHSCLGLPANRRAIGSTIAGWGYVALFVDDFATRGLRETCAVDFPEGLADAFGALAFASKLPYVDPARIAAVGYSQGADTALAIASSRFAAFAFPRDLKYRAVAAFYPPCANRAGAGLTIPTLILVGELDDVTPKADCERLVRNQPSSRADVKLVVYPGAHHLFDDPSYAAGKRLFGMLLKYDRSAAERSRSDLRDFLAARLAP